MIDALGWNLIALIAAIALLWGGILGVASSTLWGVLSVAGLTLALTLACLAAYFRGRSHAWEEAATLADRAARAREAKGTNGGR